MFGMKNSNKVLAIVIAASMLLTVAATLNFTSTTTEGGGYGGNVLVVTTDANSGSGSLRQMLADAQDGDFITFDPSVEEITLTDSIQFVQKDITINGMAGVVITKNASSEFRLLTSWANTGTLTLIGLTFDNGNTTENGAGVYSASSLCMTGCAFRNNISLGGAGGGAFADGATTLANCTFIGNTSIIGGGLGAANGDAELTGCTFIGNTATSASGGGIYVDSGDAIVTGCTFVGNEASNGGGVYVSNGDAELTGCTFIGNEASNGGGVYVSNGDAIVTSCTFTGNKAIYGSAVDAYNDITITDCGFTDNSSTGGTVYSGNVYAENCSFYADSVSGGNAGVISAIYSAVLYHSTLANNSGGATAYNVNVVSGSITIENCLMTSDTLGGDSNQGVSGDNKLIANYADAFGDNVLTFNYIMPLPGVADGANVIAGHESDAAGNYRGNAGAACLYGAVNWTAMSWIVTNSYNDNTTGSLRNRVGAADSYATAPLPDKRVVYFDAVNTVDGTSVFYIGLTSTAGGGVSFFNDVMIVGRLGSDGDPEVIVDGSGETRVFTHAVPSGTPGTSYYYGLAIMNGYADSSNMGGGIGSNDSIVAQTCVFVANEGGYGGGVIVNGDAVLTNCVFVHNATTDSGGGVYIGGDAKMTNCVFAGNTASAGAGGGAVVVGDANLEGCVFIGNAAGDYGGGLAAFNDANLEGCVFIGNAASNYGGGAYVDNDANLEGCVFIGNGAYRGGGAFVYNNADLEGCVFIGNAAGDYGGGLYVYIDANLQGCVFVDNEAYYGGGAFVYNNADLEGCAFISNESVEFGGGAFVNNDGDLKNCVFTNNTAAHGGGVYVWNGSTLTDCVFIGNIAYTDGHGGGAALVGYSGYIAVMDCTFIDNFSSYAGGGVFAWGDASLTGCVFTGNEADGSNGGGAGLDGISVITNCTFTGNTANGNGGGVYVTDAAFTDCIFTDNAASDTGSGGFGGGACVLKATFTGCVFIGNEAEIDGGGVVSAVGGDVILIDCVFTGNKAHNGAGVSGYGSASLILVNNTFYENISDNIGALSCAEETYIFHTTVTDNIGGGIVAGDNMSAYLYNCIVTGNMYGGTTPLQTYESSLGTIDFTTGSNLIEGESGVTHADVFGTNVFDPLTNTYPVLEGGIADGTASAITDSDLSGFDAGQKAAILAALAYDQTGAVRASAGAVTYGAAEVLSTVKIPATVTVTAPAGITYGDTLGDPSAVASNGGSTFTWFYTGTLSDGSSTTYSSPNKPSEPGNYTVTATLVSNSYEGDGSATFTISPKQLTWNADGTVADKTYDGSATATAATQPTLSGVINSDDVTVSNGTVAFNTANAGTNIAVTASGYGIAGTGAWKYTAPSAQPSFASGTIDKASLTITGASISAKTYDDTTAATVNGVMFSGLAGSDSLTIDTDYTASAVFDTADAGSGKTVTVTVALSGTALANNYAITNSPYSLTGQTIDAATYSGASPNIDQVVINGMTDTFFILLSGLNPSVTVGTLGTVSYSTGTVTDAGSIIDGSPSVSGSTLTVYVNNMPAGSAFSATIPISIITQNYGTIAATVTLQCADKTPVTVTVTAPADITYGGTLGDPSAVASDGGSTFSWFYTGTLSDGTSTAYSSSSKPTEPGNYTITATLVSDYYTGSGSATFTIFPKQLTWVTSGTVTDKTYDGSATATAATQPTLGGVINSDDVTVSNGTVAFNTANAGTNIAVTASGYGIAGTGAWKYTAPSAQPSFANGTIDKASLTIANASVNAKTYDNTTAATVNSVTFSGLAGGESLTLDTDYTASAIFDTADAGSGKTVTVTVALSGTALANNYTVTNSPYSLTAQTIGTATYSGPAPNISQNVLNGFADTFSIPLAFGITVSVGTLGTVSYSTGTVTDAGSIIDGSPSVSGSTLTVGVNNMPVGSTFTATIVISIQTQNYGTIAATVTLQCVDKTPVTVTVTAPADITYGGTLGDPSAVASDGGSTFTWSYTGTLSDGSSTPYSSSSKPTEPGNYTVTATLVSDDYAGSGSATFTIFPKQLTWATSGTVTDKTYDGFATATAATQPTLGGVINSDDVTVSNGTVAFNTANAGTSIGVTASGYGIAGTGAWKYTAPSAQPSFANGTIDKASLTIANASVNAKTYDNTTAATVNGVTFSGLAGGESLVLGTDYTASGVFDNANAGTGKTVTVTVALSGTALANNYAITNSPYSLAGQTIGTATYAGAAPDITKDLLNGDAAGVLGIPLAFGVTVPAGNLGAVSYTVGTVTDTGSIINGSPSISGDTLMVSVNSMPVGSAFTATIDISIQTQNYGTIAATVTLQCVDKTPVTVTVNALGNITYGGTLGNPSASAGAGGNTFTWFYTGTLSDGSSTPYSSSSKPTEPGTYTVTATLVSNDYAGIGSASFTISKKQLTWTAAGTASNKTYDGTAAATATAQPALSGVINSDDVTVSNGTVVFNSANAGTSIGVTAAGYGIAGTDAWKYLVPTAQPMFSNGTISKAGITITNASINAKTYDNTTAATVNSVTFSGLVGGESLVLGTDYTASGVFDNANAGTGKTVTVTVTLGGTALANNYTITNSPYSLAGQTIDKIAGPAAPASVTGSYGTNDNTTFIYTMTPIAGAEYSTDGVTWQDSNVFSGIAPSSSHTFYVRMKETATQEAGAVGNTGAVVFSKLNQAAPPLDYSISSGGFPKTVTITAVTGAEYSFDGGTTWVPTNTYTSPAAENVLLGIRFVDTLTNNASLASTVTVNTDNLPQNPPAAFTLSYAGVGDTSYTVTIPLTAGAEYSFDGITWNTVNTKSCLPGETVTGYKRMADKPGYNASGAVSSTVTLPLFQVKTPTASPNGGTFAATQNVSLSCATAGADIYYTLDGSVPTIGSTLYTGAFTLSATATVKAFAVKTGMTDSAVITMTFTKSSGGGGGGTNNTNASISLSSASFDENTSSVEYRDIVVTLSPGIYTLSAIRLGTYTLNAGTDYTVSGNSYTIKKEYLSTLGAGAYTLTFAMSGGPNPSLSIAVKDTRSGQTEYPVTEQPGPWNGTGGSEWRIDAPGSNFLRLMLVNEVVDTADYTVGENTLITFDESYLGTLAPGIYQYTAEFTDGYATITLEVGTGESGGDNGNVLLWVAVVAVGIVAVCIGGAVVLFRKNAT
ncbi:MAG: YDG domain-containing protein [Methanomassiliicoccaceae archaeon]|nr:YDG domain-containing protein [Methanomassiliicoccaceae archaeon]